jgi:hypothetical protein
MVECNAGGKPISCIVNDRKYLKDAGGMHIDLFVAVVENLTDRERLETKACLQC